MQKTSKKASILIWATFLSLIITVTFLSISTQINKIIKNNSNINETIKIENEIANIVNSWSIDWNLTNSYLSNWDKIIFEKTNVKIVWLKSEETHTWKIIENNSNITVRVLKWWPVTFTNWSNYWIINYNDLDTFQVSNWYFYIKNIWDFSEIEISSDTNANLLSKYRKYTIFKEIWNKQIIKTNWEILNF